MAPLPDFQNLSPKQKEGIYHHIEEELEPGLGNRALTQRHNTFVYKALARGATGPNLQPSRDKTYEVFGEEYWVYHLPVQTLVIATVCHYQVVASHSYANFHSIEEYAKFYSINMWRDVVSLALNPTSGKYTKILPGKVACVQFSIPSQQKMRSRNGTTSTPVRQ
jgi:hypothetical protein